MSLVDAPPDTSRWYVEAPLARIVPALNLLVSAASTPSTERLTALTRVAGARLVRVYWDGSAYIETPDGQSQVDLAYPGGWWPATSVASWERFKGLLGRGETQ